MCTINSGPGKYDIKSDFPDDSESAIVADLMKKKKKMKELDGVDLDNNGIDDGTCNPLFLPAVGERYFDIDTCVLSSLFSLLSSSLLLFSSSSLFLSSLFQD